jgi:transposase
VAATPPAEELLRLATESAPHAHRGAWSYRYPARVAQQKAEILVHLPKSIRDIAWKAQMRPCARYRSMIARGKKPTAVVAALARELSGFVWAIGQEVKPTMT